MTTIVQKNFCAEKSSDSSRMRLAFFETVAEAKSWIGPVTPFRITNKITNEVIDSVDPEVFDTIGFKKTADEKQLISAEGI